MQLMEEYGAVHAINLLGSKENEALLANAYDRHIQIARSDFPDDLGITHFDFHASVRLGGHDNVTRDLRSVPFCSLLPSLFFIGSFSSRLEDISDRADRFGFSLCDASMNEIITEQHGIFRTNCLDCLDRTNFVQDILSRTALEQCLTLIHREWVHSSSIWSYHGELWAENGDALSKIYAGTGALNTSFTRSGKRTLAGNFVSVFRCFAHMTMISRRSFRCHKKCFESIH